MGPLDAFWHWITNTFWPALRDAVMDSAIYWTKIIGSWFTALGLPIMTVLSFFGLVISFSWWSVQQIADSLSTFDLDSIQAGSASLLEYGAFINRFVPLVEAAAGAMLVFNIWVIVITIRWIKSLIPTLSN